jgi:acid stress-induced BolA-like protein IbaG/YrbA
MFHPEELKKNLAEGMNCAHLEVTGDGRHFQALVVSAEFEGLSRVRRHQHVFKVLSAHMHDDAVHALSVTTLTPNEWQQKNG